jgi:hypothetical protein
VGSVHLVDGRCRTLLALDVATYDVSPDGRFLMSWPPEGAPVASDHSVRLFDLGSGKRVHTKLDNREFASVSEVHWDARTVSLVVKTGDAGGGVESILLP